MEQLITISKQFVRYQYIPAYLFGHHVTVVYHFVPVQKDISVKIASEYFHCVDCKLMGTISTLREYTCST